MKTVIFFLAPFSLLILSLLIQGIGRIEEEKHKIKGITMEAPPKIFEHDPMPAITAVHADWVAIIPYAYTPANTPEVRYAKNHWQWWGEQPEGIKESIRLAKKSNLRVMLKPQVYMHNSWIGEMDFDTEDSWRNWEIAYEEYIKSMVQIAIDEQVDMFCIGTEINIAAKKRSQFWNHLINSIRSKYHGKLVYSTNWDFYEQIPFWSQLDYIGINAYFPLSEVQTPNVEDLKNKWEVVKLQLRDFSNKINKKILFTEYGYLSVDGCAGKTWELEKNVESLAINEVAQANAIKALHESFYKEEFWAGGFLWKWFPNGHGHEGYVERDYTPQHKRAEDCLRTCFRKYD